MPKRARKRPAAWVELREGARAKYLDARGGVPIRIVVIEIGAEELPSGATREDLDEIPECMK